MKTQPSITTARLPGFIYISFFSIEDGNDASKILDSIARKGSSEEAERLEDGVRLKLQDALCTVELIKEKSFDIFTISIDRPNADTPVKEWRLEFDSYQKMLEPVIAMLPQNPALLLSIHIIPAGGQFEALKLAQEYAEYKDYSRVSMGIINNCLLSTFRLNSDGNGSLLLQRNLLISPLNKDVPQGRGTVSDLVADIKCMAINLGNLNRLFCLCQPYFPQLDPGETEIQEIIEVILNRMKQTEPVELEILKSWLSNVMDRFSTLSIMSGLIIRDRTTARTYTEGNKNLLQRWSEISLEGYPTNILMETIDYNTILQPFDDFVDRTQALRTELETISNMVRTYLGIRQQEQSSEMLEKQVSMLHTIEGHEKILKGLTWWVVIFTISLVTLEILGILNILH